MLHRLLAVYFNYYVARFSQTLRQNFKEILLVLPQVKERAVFDEPLSASQCCIANGDRFSTVEDDGHVFVEVRKVVDRVCVELLFIE